MTFFGKKISIFTPKNSDDLFLVIDQVFLIFTLSFQIIRIFTVQNVVYDPFFTRKRTVSEKNSSTTPIFFYSVRAFAPISQNYFSKYWGDQCMGRPPTSSFRGTVPQSP